jgi:hypothetical protein
MPTIETNGRDLDVNVLCQQIGRMNILAISGGRVQYTNDAVVLPVGNGYRVEIELAADDTYTVRRVFKRGAKTFDKGTMKGIYAEDIGDVAYYASCFRSNDFPLVGVTA